VLPSAQTDQSQFSFPAGFWPEIEHGCFIWRRFLAPEKSGTKKVWQTDQFLVPVNCYHKQAPETGVGVSSL